ncbi:uncharacterized protein CDAR_193211 [Caerostris darwini]|uniref:Uncharacterized protein n=1 Tax=Caerostris darwini TaxID=1538125 RepID=A0AAV4UJH8_9ARAC|nr:uncharacterized protein CDAR_193211 [Caerostris darwini]
MASRSEAICISANIAEQVFPDQCSVDGEWHKLEEFWGGEKQRLQDVEAQTLSNSLEKHLMYDDCIYEPSPMNSLKEGFSSEVDLRMIKGEDIKDIPTSYVIGGFAPHEFIVIGTYVDKNILAGSQYKVRKNYRRIPLRWQSPASRNRRFGLAAKRLTLKDHHQQPFCIAPDVGNQHSSARWGKSKKGQASTWQMSSLGSKQPHPAECFCRRCRSEVVMVRGGATSNARVVKLFWTSSYHEKVHFKLPEE